MKRTLEKVIGLGTMLLSGFVANPDKAEAQFHGGSAEYVHSVKNPESSFGRLNGFYTLPGNINGFSFTELYKGNEENVGGYFGKTFLDKSISGNLGVRTELNHISEPLSQVGVGPSVSLPVPEDAYARISFLPVWFGNSGSTIGDKTMLNYTAGISLPHNINLSTFGGFDLTGENSEGKTSVQWDFGEIEATKDFGPIKVGYNPVLLNNGNVIPKVKHRAIVGVKF